MFSRTVLVLQVASERRWTPFAWYLRHGEDLRVATAQLVWTIIPRGGRQRQPDDAATESPRFSLANWARYTRRYCFDIARAFAAAWRSG